MKVETKNLKQIILQNSNSTMMKPLVDMTNEIFDKFIDQLSLIRQKLIIEIQNQYQYQYAGLTEPQKKFLKVLKDGECSEQINCQTVWEINESLNEEEKLPSNIQEKEKLFNLQQIKLKQQINLFSQRLLKCIKGINEQPCSEKQQSKQKVLREQIEKVDQPLFHNSKLINQIQDEQDLSIVKGFFDKKIKSSQLLYRASQNEFLIQKFFDRCRKIKNTFTISQTEYGNVIGGFTPLEWYRPKTSEYAAHLSGQSFIFSLTNGDKFNLAGKSRAIHNISRDGFQYGPWFGNGDFVISDKANRNRTSCGNINYTYTNKNYKYEDRNSLIKFSGSKDSLFKIKEWQVWAIQFQERKQQK